MSINKVSLFFLVVLVGSTIPAFAQKDSGINQEVVIQHRTIEQPRKKRSYTPQETNMIKTAKDVVKKYWVSSYEEIYGLLSKNYREVIKKTRNISNAVEYKNSMPVTERVWIKQTYQKADFQGNNLVQIIVLAEWEEEGYEGVMTFIFDMVKESDKWKIENIMF